MKATSPTSTRSPPTWSISTSASEIPFDPALSRYFATKLINDHGLPLVEMRQNGQTFTAAVTELENLVVELKLAHNGNPVLTWMMSNIVIQESRYSGLKHPTKTRADNKIDGVVALLMALSRAIAGTPADSTMELLVL